MSDTQEIFGTLAIIMSRIDTAMVHFDRLPEAEKREIKEVGDLLRAAHLRVARRRAAYSNALVEVQS